MKVYDTEELDSYNNNGKSSHPIVYTEGTGAPEGTASAG
jgi:hypothetical protein